MLNVIVALECEARPIVERLALSPAPARGPYRLFVADDLRLIVSGVGAVAAAGAVGFALGFDSAGGPAAWLNVGLAGARDRPLGEGFLAHKAIDAADGRAWFPAFPFRPPCATERVTTVARPETDYRGPGLYDMEAAGFFAVAARAAPAELVHAYKIVSDGPESSIGETTPERAAAAIEARLRTIGQLIERLRASAEELAAAEADPPHFARTIEDRRFTATERVQLRRLLRRWAALLPDADPWPTESGRPRRAREALDRLRERLDATPVRID